MLSQSSGSSAQIFMHNEGMNGDPGNNPNPNTLTQYLCIFANNTTDDATIDILADDDNTIADDDNTFDDDMDTDINVDAVHVHGCDSKGRGNASSTQEPDGIG